MTKFINIYGYSDCDSYAVLEDAGDTLTIQKVKRDFHPEMKVGGFSAICVNITEQKTAPVVIDETEKPITLVRRANGAIGIWEDDEILSWSVDSFVDGVLPGLLEKNANWRVKGDRVVVYAGFRKDGTPKRRFREFPKPVDTCHAFYDYNF